MLHEVHFRAMGTQVGLWLWSEEPEAAGALSAARDMFEEIEQELSRFRPDSGLCRLNAAAGQGRQPVSPILAEVTRLALEAAEDSGGLFDPTVLPALEQVGYDDSFAAVAAREDESQAGPPGSAPAWRQVRVENDLITLPAGTALDLGGIAKGWSADQVAEQLHELGPVLVDAGGDIRAMGLGAIDPWPVAIEDPLHPDQDLVVLELSEEALVTSSVGRRRWKKGGQWMHHLIDPRTQLPSTSDVHTVSVLGPTAREAEIAAKVVLMLGLDDGAFYLNARAMEGVLIGHEGARRVIGERFHELV